PLYGGNRGDSRLTSLAEALNARGIECLRFDYGDWDDGVGETQDVIEAVEYAGENWGRVALFGYSFGTVVASNALDDISDEIEALGLLAPPDEVADNLGGASLAIPVYAVAGERDTTVDSSRVIESIENAEWLEADHFYVGRVS
ncbi:MAG: alpha/beta hydrolase, partial [Halobacteria archaeon]|nr:alpha/beta hydrolase [Halobacteria archaeon]